MSQEAMHASAPEQHLCADCTMDKEACPTCYAAWWKRRHPNTHQATSPAGPDALAEEIERAKLHGPDQRTLDALVAMTARAEAAERDFIQVHKNCIEAREQVEFLRSRPAQGDSRDAERYRFVVAEGMLDGQLEGYLADNDLDEAGEIGTPEYKALTDTAIDAAMSQQEKGEVK